MSVDGMEALSYSTTFLLASVMTATLSGMVPASWRAVHSVSNEPTHAFVGKLRLRRHTLKGCRKGDAEEESDSSEDELHFAG